MEETTSQKIIKARKRQKLSQADLAALIGVSQASISRIEKSEQHPDFKLYAKIAKALKVDLKDIAPEEMLEQLQRQSPFENFYAFCPNPFCDKNEFGWNKDTMKSFVRWNSGKFHEAENYNKANFCSSCGTDLVKECPNCKQRLTDKGSRYCMGCGTEITERPTHEEWKIIEEKNKAKLADELPF